MIKAGIVGLGWWGRTLVESAENSDAIRFVAGTTRTVTPDVEAARCPGRRHRISPICRRQRSQSGRRFREANIGKSNSRDGQPRACSQ
jgi:hypothetical protein